MSEWMRMASARGSRQRIKSKGDNGILVWYRYSEKRMGINRRTIGLGRRVGNIEHAVLP